jgi:catechol 2,3-dioxygenase-like lactoylglutathione lyase family enzyme
MAPADSGAQQIGVVVSMTGSVLGTAHPPTLLTYVKQVGHDLLKASLTYVKSPYDDEGIQMSRVQLALNVSDIDAAVDFYAKLFSVEPAKRQPGYANFVIAEPPLKLVLIENAEARGVGPAGGLNHLGVEVESTDAVGAAIQQFADTGLETVEQAATTCCYAVQDKVWVSDPDGAPWEFYTVLADAPASTGLSGDGSCCAPAVADVSVPRGALELVAVPAQNSCC